LAQSDEIEKLRELVERLSESLPSSVDVAALGVKSKAPLQLLCTREALIWRTEELARNACGALERGEFAVAAILARAITENAALAWKLMHVLDTRKGRSASELHDDLIRLLLGSKEYEDFPQPFNVLHCLDKIEKEVRGARASYERLSEIAHPNYKGVFGLYSRTDEINFITYFGRGLRGADDTRDSIASVTLASLGLFEHAYNQISDMLPTFIAELDKIWSDESETETGKSLSE
jgi:hypothetical protein